MPLIAIASRSGIPIARADAHRVQGAGGGGRPQVRRRRDHARRRAHVRVLDRRRDQAHRAAGRARGRGHAHRDLFGPPRRARRAHPVPRAHRGAAIPSSTRWSRCRSSPSTSRLTAVAFAPPAGRPGAYVPGRPRCRRGAVRGDERAPVRPGDARRPRPVSHAARRRWRQRSVRGKPRRRLPARQGHPEGDARRKHHDQRRRARRPALTRGRHRWLSAPRGRPRRRRGRARPRVVRAHAGAARLRAVAPDALRPCQFKYAGGGTRVPVATRGQAAAGAGQHRRRRRHVRDRYRKPRLAHARAGVCGQERSREAPGRQECRDHRRRHRRSAACGAGARQGR